MKRAFNNRILAMLVCACIALIILSSTGFAISHAEHECSGTNCVVCGHLKDLANASKELGDGVGIFLATLLITAIFLKQLPMFFGDRLSTVSLISLKVRMNN